MQKKRKSYWSVSEIGPSPPLKVAADAADDDGQVGIWKAPLPGGTAELKIQTTFHQYQKLYSTPPWLGARTCKVSRKYSNAFLSYSAKTKRDGQTDGRTDGGRCNISRPGPSAPREIKITASFYHIWALMWRNVHFWLFYSYLGGRGSPYVEPRVTKFSGQQDLITEQTIV